MGPSLFLLESAARESIAGDEQGDAADATTRHLRAPAAAATSPRHQICPPATSLPSDPASVSTLRARPSRPVPSHQTQTLAATEAGRDGRNMDGMRAAAPTNSNFFRWCLGGMAAFASGSGSGPTSARDADAAERVMRLGKEVELECGDISASQEDLLARAPFLGGGGGGEEDAEVFSTPPLTQGQGEGEEEDVITMCSLPFTQPSPLPASPPLTSPEDKEDQAESRPRKPRVCTRKVRGARIRTPTPSPSPSPDKRSTSTSSIVDPLYRAVLMIPTTPAPPTEDLLTLARNRGIF
ncbi:hypothetical protein HU200_065054 [Digitaria exilis]|uniref:Uncharacterized protein n=1 Tax=Digitaria exilis TaxID=1010633 RepID=A0A835DXR5_9POAL|nr:hypothetical protein HU200_065054 [Digitaria exilis]